MHVAVVHNPLCAMTKVCKAGHITILDGQHSVVSVVGICVGFAPLSSASEAG